MPLWSFAPEVDPARVSKLLALADFDQVLALLESVDVVAFRWKDFENERLRGCYRAEYALRFDQDTYDAIFNAPVGLCAQYARSPTHGDAANRRVITMLASRLLTFSDALHVARRSQIEWSLSGSQAKVWIDEAEAESQLGAVQAQILYKPWQTNSETGVGLLAPRATRLEVKGGWVDSDGTVVLDPVKYTRNEDIHREGYS
jgi:hypothetical protein